MKKIYSQYFQISTLLFINAKIRVAQFEWFQKLIFLSGLLFLMALQVCWLNAH